MDTLRDTAGVNVLHGSLRPPRSRMWMSNTYERGILVAGRWDRDNLRAARVQLDLLGGDNAPLFFDIT